jgi:PKD repeat protein
MTLPRIFPRTDPVPEVPEAAQLPPVAAFSVAKLGGLVVQATDMSTDPDGVIVSRIWDWGEGPTARFTVGSVSGLTVSFLDQSFDVPPGAVTGWAWTFGDGSISTERSPVKTYQAGGTYPVTLVVTDNDGHQSAPSQQLIQVRAGGLGLPYGVWQGMSSFTSLASDMGKFNCTINADSADGVIARIRACRQLGISVFLFPWASHVWATKNGKFDMPTWQARLATFNTSAIKAEVELGRADGTVLGFHVIEEPQHPDYGGIITRGILDDCTAQTKAVFGPLMPVGTNVTSYFRPQDGPYKVLDFTQSQFIWNNAAPYNQDPVAWRNARLQDSADSGTKWVAGLNTANGGAGYSETVCAAPTGGFGISTGRCAMGATPWPSAPTLPNGQIADAGLAVIGADGFGRRAAGLLLWRHVPAQFAKADVQADFELIRAACAAIPRISLLRGT